TASTPQAADSPFCAPEPAPTARSGRYGTAELAAGRRGPQHPRDGASTPPNASQCTSPPADAAPTAAPNSNPAGTATTSLPGPEEGPPTPSTDRRSARPATCGKGISLP